MFCASPVQVKVCTSLTAATSSAVASCGGYQIRTLVVVQSNTTCTASQMQLTTANEFGLGTASPFTLTIQDGGLIAVAILLVWVAGWSFKQLGKAINGGSPE